MTYLASLLPLAAIEGILLLGLNLQYGLTGILNFTYITFVAVGAYVGGTLTMGPPGKGSLMTYILGAHVPFPLNLIAGGLAAALVGGVISVAALRRLRSDYLAITTVGAGFIIYTILGNETQIFNGWNGIFGIPMPTPPGLSPALQQLYFGGVCLVCLAIVFVAMEAIRRSPFGRVLRSIREDEDVTDAFGRNTFALKLLVFEIGCFVAGLGGALLSEYASAYNPQAMMPNETFILWAALLVGGTANNWGALVGALIVPVGFNEATRFLPHIANATLVESLRGVAIGLLIMLVLWFLPRGIIPERLPVDREPRGVGKLVGQGAERLGASGHD